MPIRGAASRTCSSGTGSSTSGAPKPRCARRPAAADCSSEREGCSPSVPQPQCLRLDDAVAVTKRQSTLLRMAMQPGILARGPWEPGQVRVRWRDEVFESEPDKHAEADEAIAALQDRGSPSHDGLAARLAS